MSRASDSSRPIREPVPVSEPGDDVGVALRQLMHTLRQNVDTVVRARGFNLSFVHGMVLKTLAREPGLSGAQVARRTIVTAQTMNGVLRSMESGGFIVRETHPEHRRADCWFLTRSGVRCLEQVHEIVGDVIGRMLAPLSRADVARLTALLHECRAALQPEAPEPSGRSGRARTPRADARA